MELPPTRPGVEASQADRELEHIELRYKVEQEDPSREPVVAPEAKVGN